MDKVMYIPFDTREVTKIGAALKEYGASGAGAMKKNQLVIDHELAKGHRAVEVWYNGKKDPFLSSMQDGQVYIRGHGMAGQNTIEGGRGGENLRYDEIVHRLMKSGLRKTFQGKIKCYNCHSAETIDPTGSIMGSITETNGQCFAQLVADEMYAEGYRQCTFYGYEGSIDSMPKDGSQGVHKYVRGYVKGLDGISRQVELGRMSELRHQFAPMPVVKKPGFFKRLFG